MLPAFGFSASSLAVFFALSSALFHACFNAVLKTGNERHVLRAVTAWFAALWYLPLLLLVPLPSGKEFLFLLLSSAMHFIYQLFQANSLKYADVTVGYPITRGSSPLFVTLGAWLILGEVLPPTLLLGALIISMSLLCSAPFKKLKSDSLLRKGAFWSLLTGVGVAAYTLTDAHFSRQFVSPLTFIAWFFPFNGLFMTVLIFYKYRKGRLFRVIAAEKNRALLAGAIAALSYGSIIIAYNYAQAETAKVAALREVSVVFGMLIGFWFLRETITRGRIIAAAGVLLGCFIIKLR